MFDINLKIIQGICQRPCSFCHYAHLENSDRKLIDLDSIKKFCEINYNDKYLFRISIIPAGDPLMHPQFFEILKILTSYQYNLLHLSTNLAYELTDEEILQLLSFDQIGINYSLYNIDPELIKKTENNINRLNAIIKQENRKNNINICYVIHPRDKIEQVEEMRQTFKDLNIIESPLIVFDKDYIDNLSSDIYSEYVSRVNILDSDKKFDNDNRLLIAYLDDIRQQKCGPTLCVHTNSRFTACSVALDRMQDMYLDDVRNKKILDILKSTEFQDHLDSVTNRKFEKCQYCMSCGSPSESDRLISEIKKLI